MPGGTKNKDLKKVKRESAKRSETREIFFGEGLQVPEEPGTS